MSSSTPKSYSTDPTLWLYTSLSSGSSHIVTATSRLETILKANKVPFQALDVATDEKARMLWGRRAGKRKLPGLVRMGLVVADLEEVEEWNEYGEIKENLGSTAAAPAPTTTPSASTSNTPSKLAPTAPPMPEAKSTASTATTTKPATADSKPITGSTPKSPPPAEEKPSLAGQMRSMGAEAAEKAKQMRTAKLKAMAAGVSTSKSQPSKAENSAESKENEGEEDAEELEGEGEKDAAESEEAKESLSKLDNSGPTGLPPPSGETSAKDAAAPETGDATVESKADTVPITDANKAEVIATDKEQESTAATASKTDADAEKVDAKGPESPLPQAENPLETASVSKPEPESVAAESTTSLSDMPENPTHHRGSSLSMASKEEIKRIEEANKIQEESDEGEELENKEKATTQEAAAEPASPAQETSVAASETEKPKIEPVADDAEQKDEHVKFGGEAQGEEIDRVKAALEHNVPKLPAESSKEEAEKETNPAAAASSDKAEDLPGTKTQSQDAADANKAGESVAD